MPSGTDRDFELRIAPAAADGSYPVAVTVRPDGRRAEGAFHMPFSADEVTRALGWMEQGLFDADYARQFGAALFQALFAGDIGEVYTRSLAANETAPRIRLILEDAAVARVPWELLYDPSRQVFLALAGAFVRDIRTMEATQPLSVTPPLRILVATASPAGVPAVDAWDETGGIRQALGDLLQRRRVDFAVLPHATLARLQNALREAADAAAPRPIHLVHFIGHGRLDAATGHALLLFEHETAPLDEVDADTLANVLQPYGVKLVFLNACESAQSSAMDMAQGFAPTLLARGIPAVIGMQVTVLDALAIQFARAFYEALADNAPVDAALADARRLARGTDRRRKADMGIPVCYLRTESGRILDVAAASGVALTRATWRAWLGERLTVGRLAVAGVGALVLLAALLVLMRDPSVQHLLCDRVPVACPVPAMTGDLNVAIARFGVDPASAAGVSTVEADGLSQSVYTFLDTELDKLTRAMTETGRTLDVQIQTRGPDITGEIRGADRQARGKAAEALARRIHADVVLYGDLSNHHGVVSLTPELYVSDRTLALAAEVSGQYEFGAAVDQAGDITRNPVARAELKARLGQRIRALGQFVFGLGYFGLGRYDDAYSYFRQAADNPDWRDADGKEVVYFFLGNTALQRGALPDAADQFAHALRLAPEYARAQLGTAEVLFQRAHADCSATRADGIGLRAAAAGYQRALDAETQPALSALPAKALFGLGRTWHCLSQAGFEDRWTDADSALRKVVAATSSGDASTQQLAAEAAGEIGLGQVLRARRADDPVRYRAALAAYQQAASLVRDVQPPRPEREALFLTWVASCHQHLGENALARSALAQADAAYAHATRLDPTYETFRAATGRQVTAAGP